MTRLEGAFDEAALVAYLVGCHPSRDAFLENADALIEGGVDVLEVGIPFSDPIADGPTIQQAVTQALEAGVTPGDVIDACSLLREEHPGVPLVVMTYANIAHRMGYDVFADRLREAGVDGAILADVPPEAAGPVQEAFGEDLDQVFLASPATGEVRVRRIARATRGFLYVVGRFGTTGAQDALAKQTLDVVQRVAPLAEEAGVPACVGFGISSGEQAGRLVGAGADGVVVGSAFVEKVLAGEQAGALGRLAGELTAGIEDGA